MVRRFGDASVLNHSIWKKESLSVRVCGVVGHIVVLPFLMAHIGF